ncbi:MAG: extracellular solute-binding protein, partial [Planctomycetota bacterium]
SGPPTGFLALKAQNEGARPATSASRVSMFQRECRPNLGMIWLFPLLWFLASACSDDASQDEKTLVIRCGRTKALVAPILAEFEKSTGIKLSIGYDKTATFANVIAAEGDLSPCDVFFAQDSGHLGALAAAGHLQKISPSLLERVSPQFRDADGRWVGTSGRARVLVYNPDRVTVDSLPEKIEDLADPKWKGRLSWAPANGSFKAHLSHLRHRWGASKTRTWLSAVNRNEPMRFQKNSPQVKAVAEGRVDMAWVNHYYLHRARQQNPNLKARNHSFEAKDPGNILIVAGVGIVTKDPKQQALAEKLIEFLLSEKAQRYFAEKDFEYPIAAGVKAHADLEPLDEVGLDEVDQRHLIDIGPSNALLKSLGIR